MDQAPVMLACSSACETHTATPLSCARIPAGLSVVILLNDTSKALDSFYKKYNAINMPNTVYYMFFIAKKVFLLYFYYAIKSEDVFIFFLFD